MTKNSYLSPFLRHVLAFTRKGKTPCLPAGRRAFLDKKRNPLFLPHRTILE
ncbi:MAG: hypothetical protein ACI8P3_002163 [Saprospiraceae bacterium]|jgi:hypothetical protein